MLKVYFIFILILISFIYLALHKKKFNNFVGKRRKSKGIECGFKGKKVSRVPFSLRFFLILILFLIFDIEVILVLQFPLFGLGGFKFYLLSLKSFLLILFLGTLEEWRLGFLKWVCEKIFMGS